MCRCWRDIARTSTDLLKSASFKVGGPRGADYACRVLDWLCLMAASRMRSMHLDTVPPPGGAGPAAAMAAACERLLMACADAGRLSRLHLDLSLGLPPTSWLEVQAGDWLGRLPALLNLHLSTSGTLSVPSAVLWSLPRLQECTLLGRPLQMQPSTVPLPAGLVSLTLGGLDAASLPTQQQVRPCARCRLCAQSPLAAACLEPKPGVCLPRTLPPALADAAHAPPHAPGAAAPAGAPLACPGLPALVAGAA